MLVKKFTYVYNNVKKRITNEKMVNNLESERGSKDEAKKRKRNYINSTCNYNNSATNTCRNNNCNANRRKPEF